MAAVSRHSCPLKQNSYRPATICALRASVGQATVISMSDITLQEVILGWARWLLLKLCAGAGHDCDSGEVFSQHRLLVDATGVGAAVLDHLRAAGLQPIGILIHGGDVVTRAPWVFRVPKRDLVGIVSVRLQNRSLRFTNAGPYAAILQRELLNFRVKIDPVTSHDSYAAWREGEHDDLVLATAIALWWGDRQPLDAGAKFGIIHARV